MRARDGSAWFSIKTFMRSRCSIVTRIMLDM